MFSSSFRTKLEVKVEIKGLPIDEREMVLDLLDKVRKRMFPPEKIRELDEKEIFPEEIIRELLGPDIGLQLLFIPEEYDGMGGGARDIAVISEQMAKICLGLATSFLAIHLGTDPILVGSTDEQKAKWLNKIVDDGAIVSYAVTEPEAGSNLANLKTKADPITDENGTVISYRINGNKQFISNGRFADFLTVLAQTPEGPSFFIVENNTEGYQPGKPEVKHGIRCANTSPIAFENVVVPAENLVGEKPGEGMNQANEVFGYTRLMVAAFGLGAGMAVLEKVIPYAKERIQFGSPLIEKAGYTHKLILPHVINLEAARAYIEEVAYRLDAGERDLQTEGSIAKLFATEAGNKCADDGIQALGGYGYITEYDVEKVKRDVKITTIYEGTSEIQQLIIATYRWRSTVKSKGKFYNDIAEEMKSIHLENDFLGAGIVGDSIRGLNNLIQQVHKKRLTRHQHIMFMLADMMTYCEVAAALIRKITRKDPSTTANRLQLISRLFSTDTAQLCHENASIIVYGSDKFSDDESKDIIKLFDFNPSLIFKDRLNDLDQLLGEIV